MQSTIDPEEAARFERLADTWWDPAGPFWPLHKLNTLRTDYLRKRVTDRIGVRVNPPLTRKFRLTPSLAVNYLLEAKPMPAPAQRPHVPGEVTAA